MAPKRVYIAGPMTGLPDWNYPSFTVAAEKLRAEGHDVVNPAEAFDGDTSLDWTTYLQHNLAQLLTCEEIVLLPGWDMSRGAKIEFYIANALGFTTRFLGIGPTVAPVSVGVGS